MRTEWTAARRKAMKRNAAIVGRNRFMQRFNDWFSTRYPNLPLEALPDSYERSPPQDREHPPQEKAA